MNSLYDNVYFYTLSSLIRISAGRRIFAPLRSFSQLVTSFFGAMYQGILRMLFVAWSFSLNSIFTISSYSSFFYKNSTLLTRLIFFVLTAKIPQNCASFLRINLKINHCLFLYLSSLSIFLFLSLSSYAVVRLRISDDSRSCFSTRKTLLSNWQPIYIIKILLYCQAIL